MERDAGQTHRWYAWIAISMMVPFFTGMDDTCSPDSVVIGNASGITSSRLATLPSIQIMGCSRSDSCFNVDVYQGPP